MIGWLKRLFGVLDRSDLASERIAVALEQMADDMEAARAMLRDRLGVDPEPATETEELPSVKRNGRKAIGGVS